MSKREYEFHPWPQSSRCSCYRSEQLAVTFTPRPARVDVLFEERSSTVAIVTGLACQLAWSRVSRVERRLTRLANIVSKNVKRRHLTQSQKAMVVAKVANLPRGNPQLASQSAPCRIRKTTIPKSPQNGELELNTNPRKGSGKTTAQVAQRLA